MDSRVRASPEQLTTLLKYMESHGDLTRPLDGAQGRLRSDRLWAELTNTLNAVDGGVSKTTDKWKKVWADWKSKTKKKAFIIRHHVRGAVGGPATRQTLSVIDERVLAVMNTVALEGQSSIEELRFNRSQFSASSQLSVLDAQDQVHLEIEHEIPKSPQSSTSELQPSNLPSSSLIQTLSPRLLVLAPPSSQGRQPATPQALPARTAPALTPRRRRLPTAGASATSPSARRRPRLRLPVTPQSTASLSRPSFRPRRQRAPTSCERVATEFATVELRRLELEETRTRLQHERDLRALEVEHERNQIFSSLVNVAQAWLDYYRSRDNAKPLKTE